MNNIIIGAGLAGLAAAYANEKNSHIILESQNEVGGLARSIRQKGFTFDYSIHMLHIRKKEVLEIIKKILPHELQEHPRKAGILIENFIVPYPFQNNLFHIKNEQIKKECVDGIVKASKNFKSNYKPINFEDWIMHSQGSGISKYFMKPYNEKCYGVSLDKLNLDWLGRFVPQPDLNTIIEGSKIDKSKENVGYNYKFYYSKSGGIDWLPKAFSKHINNIKLSEKVEKIDLIKKYLITNKRKYQYNKIVSTIPIKKLIQKIINVPNHIIEASEKLICNSVSTVLLGIDRANISDLQWLYIPDKKILPYRISFPMNYSSKMAPPGTSSVCCEFSYFGVRKMSNEELIGRTIDDLVKVNILNSKDKIIFQKVVDLKNAYVIFDRNRKNNLDIIKKYLNENGISTIGRFGNWEYSSMEDAIFQGLKIK